MEKEKMGMSNITDKVVVITGASSGVGESTARLPAGNGAKVALGARRKDRIDALVRDITAKGGCALGFKTDVTKRGDVEALVKGAVDRHGRIDAIVNNSGIMPIAPMAALKVEEWDRMIDVHIKGLLYGVAAVLPIMQKQKLGHIINIASVAGFKVFAPGGTVDMLLKLRLSDQRIADYLFLSAFSRYPTGKEREAIAGDLRAASGKAATDAEGWGTADPRRPVLEDLLWAMLTSKEFMFNH